jgi:hypothetical protein
MALPIIIPLGEALLMLISCCFSIEYKFPSQTSTFPFKKSAV